MKFMLALVVSRLLLAPAATTEQKKSVSTELTEILDRMQAHDEWQNRFLLEYQLHRRFYAANPRFKQESVVEAKTVFRQPSTFETEVVRTEGSELIRERVFDKILEAEKEANTKKTRQEVNITPANYNFTLLGQQDCSGRPCYNLRITPKQKTKYSLEGQIWVDAEDGAIVRMQGSPARRPSFWTLNTQIERRYKRIEGVWLCDVMESTSNILIAGKSTLKVDYNYFGVETSNASR